MLPHAHLFYTAPAQLKDEIWPLDLRHIFKKMAARIM